MQPRDSHIDPRPLTNNSYILPKISRTIELGSMGHSSRFQVSSDMDMNVDYSLKSTKMIEKQYNRLRQQLLRLNQLLTQKLEPIMNGHHANKSRLKVQNNRQDVLQQELKNNQTIRQRLREQLEQLEKRKEEVSTMGKQDVEDQIDKMKIRIEVARKEVRVLEMASKQMGNSIECGDQIFEQIQYLEREKMNFELRKRKTQERATKVESEKERIQAEEMSINQQAQKAARVLSEIAQKQKQAKQAEKSGNAYSFKIAKVQALKKNISSIVNIKQLRYEKLLKQLEQYTNRIAQKEQKIKHADVLTSQKKQKLEAYKVKLRTVETERAFLLTMEDKQQQQDHTVFISQIPAGKQTTSQHHQPSKQKVTRTFQQPQRASRYKQMSSVGDRLSQKVSLKKDTDNNNVKTVDYTNRQKQRLNMSHQPKFQRPKQNLVQITAKRTATGLNNTDKPSKIIEFKVNKQSSHKKMPPKPIPSRKASPTQQKPDKSRKSSEGKIVHQKEKQVQVGKEKKQKKPSMLDTVVFENSKMRQQINAEAVKQKKSKSESEEQIEEQLNFEDRIQEERRQIASGVKVSINLEDIQKTVERAEKIQQSIRGSNNGSPA